MKKILESIRFRIEDWLNPIYCSKCNGCGYIGCCGIRRFLKEHVDGKTNCPNETMFISEIIGYVEECETFVVKHPGGDEPKMSYEK